MLNSVNLLISNVYIQTDKHKNKLRKFHKEVSENAMTVIDSI